MRAIVVDKDYGSVTPQELDRVAAAYQAAGIQMELLEYQVEATRQKEPTEEEIEKEYARLAEAYKMEVEKLKEFMGDAEKKQMKEDMAVQEAVTFLAENAVEK